MLHESPKREEELKTAARMQKGANPPRRTALGRGLSSLMKSTMVNVDVKGQLEEKPASAEAVVTKEAVRAVRQEEIETPAEDDGEQQPIEESLLYVSLERIAANTSQPRQHFPEAEIKTLAKSIADSGMLQPIILRPKKGVLGPEREYEVVAGERRFRAAKLARLAVIPAIVKNLDDQETLELAIIENIQRTDLNPIEEANAYLRLVEQFGQSHTEIAKTVGKDRASVANTTRLLKLPEEIQQMLISGALSAGHGRALLMIDSPSKQKALANRIVRESMSVRGAEEFARGKVRGGKTKAAKSGKEASVLELEERLRRVLGTKVSLTMNKRGKGEIRISFFSESELSRLLERLDA